MTIVSLCYYTPEMWRSVLAFAWLNNKPKLSDHQLRLNHTVFPTPLFSFFYYFLRLFQTANLLGQRSLKICYWKVPHACM